MNVFSNVTLKKVLTLSALVLIIGGVAFAQDAAGGSVIDKYSPGDITNFLSDPVTPIAHEVKRNWWITSILILPFLVIPQLLLIVAIAKYAKKNDGRKPATFHDNLPLEIFWTIVPALVLVMMAIPTYGLIRKIENPPVADVKIDIIGYRFFWEYQYPDYGGFSISSAGNAPLVIPANKNIVTSMTSKDVIHAWWVPAFGVKMDTVPGRLSQVWFNVEKEGWYEGQCAEICGAGHAVMWIDVLVLPEDEFLQWVAEKQAENGIDPNNLDGEQTEPAVASTQ